MDMFLVEIVIQGRRIKKRNNKALNFLLIGL